MPVKKATLQDVKQRKALKIESFPAKYQAHLSQYIGLDLSKKECAAAVSEIECIIAKYNSEVPNRTTVKKVYKWLIDTDAKIRKLEQSLLDIHPTTRNLLSVEGYTGIASIDNISRLKNEITAYLKASSRCQKLAKGWDNSSSKGSTAQQPTLPDPFRADLIASLFDTFQKHAPDSHQGFDMFKCFICVVLEMANIACPHPIENQSRFNALFKHIDRGSMPLKSKLRPIK